jgi:hypothetical protein
MEIDFKQFAREYVFSYEDITVTISRYNNHHRLLPDDAWCVSIYGSPTQDATNHHYLNHGGEYNGQWLYKHGTRFATAEDAFRALQIHGTPKREKAVK